MSALTSITREEYEESLDIAIKALEQPDNVIDEEPTVDFVKRGHWIFRTDRNFCGMYKCSVCRDTLLIPSRYCPMCGARMDDEVTE